MSISTVCNFNCFTKVVPCKNGLIALDEEALPVISSRKKAIADVVVKVLSAYYKKRRIASKVSPLKSFF